MAIAQKDSISQLRALGQSLWLDYIRRQLITSGELDRLRNGGISGLTSNPTIFQKSVAEGVDYDQALAEMVSENRYIPEAAMWKLILEDILGAAEALLPVYEETKGADGFVSVEVSPQLAYDTQGTLDMVRALFRKIDRPNVMVKIPATREGLPAIRQALAEGININITLIFSVERYVEVVEAFFAGLEELAANGGDVSQVASVASFFVSRVDTAVDKLLDAKIAQGDPHQAEQARSLLGRAGIANSIAAYQQWERLHNSSRWESLAAKGARPQRCLWASTSTKDKRFPDTMYVEHLIGRDTVNTVPPATLDAFVDHGQVQHTLDRQWPTAERELNALKELGIDLGQVTQQLEEEGVKAFDNSFQSLLKTIENKMEAIRTGHGPRQWQGLGRLQSEVDSNLGQLDREEVGRRLWAVDASLWPAANHPEQWLGWLRAPDLIKQNLGQLNQLAEAAKEYADVVVMGMGGSSLAPTVLKEVFPPRSGFPRLHVLDTTDPQTILDLRQSLDLSKTLFIAASKSGSTVETRSHLEYFWEAVRSSTTRPEHNFAVITDPGSELEELAQRRDFRWIFEHPVDVGGRYSALTFVGMVPAACIGLDLNQVLARTEEMSAACAADLPALKNQGVWLGNALGKLALEGRNKLTLITEPALSSFGGWVEQLIAESTGKDGKGLLPVNEERLADPSKYGRDRVFVVIRSNEQPFDPAVKALQQAGYPVITLTLRDNFDLAGEFFRWEVATAVVGHLIGIDPFNQPNVQESKDNTLRVLKEYQSKGQLPSVEELDPDQAGAVIASELSSAQREGYFTVMAYTTQTSASDEAIAQIRQRVRQATWLATTAGYGPRFLHSTGQYHKGGPRAGVFLQVVQEDASDAAIPGAEYTFSVLKQAQALGDLEALRSRDLPVVRVNLDSNPTDGWRRLTASIDSALN